MPCPEHPMIRAIYYVTRVKPIAEHTRVYMRDPGHTHSINFRLLVDGDVHYLAGNIHGGESARPATITIGSWSGYAHLPGMGRMEVLDPYLVGDKTYTFPAVEVTKEQFYAELNRRFALLFEQGKYIGQQAA